MMIYQGARTERAKRLYIFAVCLVLLTSMVQISSIRPAYAMPALPIEEFEQLAPQFEVIKGGLEGISASGHPEAALAIIAALGGILLTSETRGFLPRALDIWLATNPDITPEEEAEIYAAIYKLDRDGYIYMADLTQFIRRPIFDFVNGIRDKIANEGKWTIDDIEITEGDFVDTDGDGRIHEYIPFPAGGSVSLTFVGTPNPPSEIRHPYGSTAGEGDLDGSYYDKLDWWRFHNYSNYTLRLDYFRTGGSQVMKFYNLPNFHVFGDDWNGEPYTIGFTSDAIFLNGELWKQFEDFVPDTRIMGHSDVYVNTNATNLLYQVGSPDEIEFVNESYLANDTEFTAEFQEFINAPVVDIGTAFGQSMVVIPEADPDEWQVGEISPASESVLQPIPESMPQPRENPAPDPYPDGGLGDLPVTIPDEVDGSKIPKVRNLESFKEHFPFSLPWDIQRIFDLFNKYASEPPSFEITLGDFIVDSSSQTSSQTFEINLDWMQEYIPFIHVMELIIADLMLIMWILRHYVAG